MSKDADRIKSRIQAGVAVVNACALVACGSAANPPLQNSGGTYFKSVTLHSSKVSQRTGSQSAFRRKFADACVAAKNLQVSGFEDVTESAGGTLSNGDSVNVSWSDDSTGYGNYVTSPIAGGFNVADVQANLTGTLDVNGNITTGQPINIMQGVSITTYGNTVVRFSQTTTGTPLNFSIVNNGTTMQNIPLDTPITLAHGETVQLTRPYMVTFGDGQRVNQQTFTETVTDPSSGGKIALQAIYVEAYDAYPGDPPYIDLTVTGTNVIMGGQIVTTALADDPGAPGTPCSTSSPGSTPPPSATPPPSPAPLSPVCPIQAGPIVPIAHPTQNASGGNPCTS